MHVLSAMREALPSAQYFGSLSSFGGRATSFLVAAAESGGNRLGDMRA